MATETRKPRNKNVGSLEEAKAAILARFPDATYVASSMRWGVTRWRDANGEVAIVEPVKRNSDKKRIVWSR